MNKFEDFTGKKIYKLTVIKRTYENLNRTDISYWHRISVWWECQCDCGNRSLVTSQNLRNGLTKSCGCMKREQIKDLHKKQRTHGQGRTKLYAIWNGMRRRCFNIKNQRYGGRGIKVCKEWWESFELFRDWSLDNGYKEGLTIDRINNDGNYEPGNCRWVTCKENLQNTSRNRNITIKGETYCLSEWARRAGIGVSAFWNRLKRGWTAEEALTVPTLKSHERLKDFLKL